jgi:hypothetical protein
MQDLYSGLNNDANIEKLNINIEKLSFKKGYKDARLFIDESNRRT